MNLPTLSKKSLYLFLAIVFFVELIIYLWAIWTTTLDVDNFFNTQPKFVFDKCARLAGRVSSALILATMLMVGYYGLKKIFADEHKKNAFLILLSSFSFNHLIHLLYVILRFRSHEESISLNDPDVGGTIHGAFTFALIVICPLVLWNCKRLNGFLYTFVIFHLLNISVFTVKTFLGKVKPPENPAYHNQLGIFLITTACLYILYKVCIENTGKLRAS